MSSPMPSSRIFLLLFAFLGITFSPSIAFFNAFSYAFFAHLSSPLRLPWHHLHLLWHLLHLLWHLLHPPWHLLRLLWHLLQHLLLLELLHHLLWPLLLLLLYPLLLLREPFRQHQHHQQELPHQHQQGLPHQHQQVHFQQLQHHFHL